MRGQRVNAGGAASVYTRAVRRRRHEGRLRGLEIHLAAMRERAYTLSEALQCARHNPTLPRDASLRVTQWGTTL